MMPFMYIPTFAYMYLIKCHQSQIKKSFFLKHPVSVEGSVEKLDTNSRETLKIVYKIRHTA